MVRNSNASRCTFASIQLKATMKVPWIQKKHQEAIGGPVTTSASNMTANVMVIVWSITALATVNTTKCAWWEAVVETVSK